MDILPQTETDATSVASYWGVIPLPVRHCKALQPAAKLLFSEITALTKREGYCWASNAYFQALYEVDRATVKRWLAALVREEFIRIDLVPGTGIRRIYDLTIPPTQKRAGGGAKTNPPRRKNASDPAQKRTPEWYIKEEKEKSIESYARAGFVGPGPVAARDLKAEEEKVTASPSTVKSNSGKSSVSAARLRQVQRVVAMTKDTTSKDWFERIWDALDKDNKLHLWPEAISVFKSSPKVVAMPPSSRAQAFADIVYDLVHQAA